MFRVQGAQKQVSLPLFNGLSSKMNTNLDIMNMIKYNI